MRKISVGDAFKAARLIKHSGLKELFIEIYNSSLSTERTEESQKKLGIDVVFSVLDALAESKVETEFYELIEGITGKTDMANMPIEEFMDDLNQIIAENDIKSFFTSVLRMVGKSST